MGQTKGPLRVARVRSSWVRQDGSRGHHESVLLRQSWRDGKTVRHSTVASLTHLPAEVVDSLEAVLNKGAKALTQQPLEVQVAAGLRHGDVALIWAMAKKLGLPKVLGPAGRQRDIAMGLVIARLARPASKLDTLTWFDGTTLGQDLNLTGISTDEAYNAMDWLVTRQTRIEQTLAARHLTDLETNPDQLALVDLTSCWMEGTCCPLSKYGYSRDKKRGKPQIEFALITNPDGVPVAVKAFEGNTTDPAACTPLVETLTGTLGVKQAVLVADRGMLSTTRIDDLKKNHQQLGWISALKRSQFRVLASEQGPLQMSLFDTQDIAEVRDPAFPGERLIACHNPSMGVHRAAKRERLIEATIRDLDKIAVRIKAGRLKQVKQIGLAVGKIIGTHQAARFIDIEISTGRLVYGRNHQAIDVDAALDGIYVIRTSLTSSQMDTNQVVRSYKRLSRIEQDFAIIKGNDIQVRPVWHHRADRVQAHLLVCMLACYLAWHLRRVLAPLTFTDTHLELVPDPVKARHRSKNADIKAATGLTELGTVAYSFRGLLDHLAQMQRVLVTVTTPTGPATYTRITEATIVQALAFKQLGVPVPTSLQWSTSS